MNQDDKRRLANELTVMGLPGLDDPALVQALADVVNGYPFMQERVEFFCDLLNECEGSRRTEMYEAMRPRLAFDVPALSVCESRIAAKAERLVGRTRLARAKNGAADDLPAVTLQLKCAGCGTTAEFTELTTAGAMSLARRAGWGRGPVRGQEHCAECRLAAMLPNRVAPLYTRRNEKGAFSAESAPLVSDVCTCLRFRNEHQNGSGNAQRCHGACGTFVFLRRCNADLDLERWVAQ